VEGGVILGDALPWLCGVENTIKAFVRNPHFLHKLLDIILEWDLRYIQLLLKTGCVDLIVHRGWYENAHFWPPRLYRNFLAPRLKKLVECVHQGGAKFGYILTMGITPLLDILKDMDIDVLYGVDPVQGGVDLAKMKMEIGDHICLWGGVNAAVTLGYETRESVERMVTDAITTLAPGGGFILSAIDQLFEDTPWSNIEAMVKTWHKSRMYTQRWVQ